MRRSLLAWLMAAVLCCMFITGCSGTDGPQDTQTASVEPTDTEDGVISLTVWAEAANNDMLYRMIDDFKQEYAGQAEFDIQIEESADADARDKVLSDIHTAADVFPFADDQLSSLVAAGALSRVPNASEVAAANQEGAVEAATVADDLYAYPMSADNGFFLYYDKDYFSEEDVKTLDRILEVAADNGKKFSMEWDSGWYTYAFFGNTGLEFGINDDGVTNYCNWNTTEGDIIGADIVESMMDIAASPGFLDLPDSEFISNVQSGKVIAGVSGVWNAIEVQAVWGDDYGAVKLPTFTCSGQQIQMSSFVGYKMYGVNAYGDHVEWAHKLADWLTNEQNQVMRFEERNQGPSNINAAASDEVNSVPAIRAVIEQSQYGDLQRVGNNYWTPFAEFGEALASGETNGATPQEMIDTLVEGITASTVN